MGDDYATVVGCEYANIQYIGSNPTHELCFFKFHTLPHLVWKYAKLKGLLCSSLTPFTTPIKVWKTACSFYCCQIKIF
jgi:hypothetical protein